ncbi:MAG: hypothetical protein KBT47_05085, partial [Armatimonadetes bacterium]|nr:hypothetical protein [Candidatus Hippobium faecium]
MNKQEYENKINDFLKKWKLTPEIKEIFTEIADFIFKTCVMKKKISFKNKKKEDKVPESLKGRGFVAAVSPGVIGLSKFINAKQDSVNVFDFLEKVGEQLKETDEKSETE